MSHLAFSLVFEGISGCFFGLSSWLRPRQAMGKQRKITRSWRILQKSCPKYYQNTYKHLQNTFKTPSKHLQNTFPSSCRPVQFGSDSWIFLTRCTLKARKGNIMKQPVCSLHFAVHVSFLGQIWERPNGLVIQMVVFLGVSLHILPGSLSRPKVTRSQENAQYLG